MSPALSIQSFTVTSWSDEANHRDSRVSAATTAGPSNLKREIQLLTQSQTHLAYVSGM
jgi:hypothetical protein